MRAADTILLLFYFGLMVGVGVYFARYMKNLDVYFVGGKKLPWWLGGVSFLMSSVSALSIVMYAGMGYRYGLVSITLYATSVPACLLTSALFARRWHRAGVSTPVEFLERRALAVWRTGPKGHMESPQLKSALYGGRGRAKPCSRRP